MRVQEEEDECPQLDYSTPLNFLLSAMRCQDLPMHTRLRCGGSVRIFRAPTQSSSECFATGHGRRFGKGGGESAATQRQCDPSAGEGD